MKKNDINWISWFALVLSIAACIITWLRVEIYTTNDTFVGLMTGFIGTCTTIIVGFQIFSYIDSNKRIKELNKSFEEKIEKLNTTFDEKMRNSKVLQNKLKYDLEKNEKERKRLELLMHAGVSHCYGLSLWNKQPFTAYDSIFNSICWAVEAYDTDIINNYLDNIIALTEIIEDLPIESIETTSMDTVEKLNFDILNQFPIYSLIYDKCMQAQISIQKYISEVEKIKKGNL